MQFDCLKLNCSECCKRYWIPLLPAEASRIAGRLGVKEREFIKRRCVAVAALYKCEENSGPLSLNSEMLPKKAAVFAEHEFGFVPQRFLVLPYLALRRKNGGECVFLRKGKCGIHGSAPEACALFPVISTNAKPLKELYPFCAAMQQKGLEAKAGGLDKEQRAKTKAYFKAVEKKGFKAQYPAFPGRFLILFEGEKELGVTKKEFFQATQPIM